MFNHHRRPSDTSKGNTMRALVRSLRTCAAGIAAAACAVAISAAPALAQTTPEYGNIDTSKTGSININQHLHQSGSTPIIGNPAGPDTIPTDGVDGVTFTAHKIDLDLSKAENWDKLSDLKVPADACVNPATIGGYNTTQVGTDVTENGGKANFENLPVAAYLVGETDAPAEVADRAAPFIVTVPFPDATNSKGWLYDVNVYPKNATAGVNKKVAPQENVGLGSEVKFLVTVTVPQIAAGNSFASFIIQGPMDSHLGNVGVKSVTRTVLHFPQLTTRSHLPARPSPWRLLSPAWRN